MLKISLNIDSGTWDFNGADAMNHFKDFFANRDVEVIGTHGYGSCTISTHKRNYRGKERKNLAEVI